MRMPLPGQRYVAATWIAIGAACGVVVAGSLALLVVGEALSAGIVLRWVGLKPDWTLDLGEALLLGAVLTLGGCLLFLGIGMAMHRSIRHGMAGHALGASSSSEARSTAWPSARPLVRESPVSNG